MGKKGKGRKRREANFKASHPDSMPRLAPPPTSKDVSAVPAKLRRIMQFRETGSPANVHAGADIGYSKKQSKESRCTKQGKEEIRNAKAKKEEAPPGAKDASKTATSVSNDRKQGTADVEVADEKTPKPLSKRKREHEELLQLAERIKAHPVRTGISDRKKKYLDEKKKKRLKNSTVQALLNQPQRESIPFGDIVQAPPKLAFPEKNKVTMKEARPVSHERVRLQAIEAYRQRRGTKTVLGKGLPVSMPMTGDAT